MFFNSFIYFKISISAQHARRTWFSDALEHISEFVFTTDTTYLALTGELWGVCCEEFEENWPNYNGTTLYLMIQIRLLKAQVIYCIFFLLQINFREFIFKIEVSFTNKIHFKMLSADRCHSSSGLNQLNTLQENLKMNTFSSQQNKNNSAT